MIIFERVKDGDLINKVINEGREDLLPEIEKVRRNAILMKELGTNDAGIF